MHLGCHTENRSLWNSGGCEWIEGDRSEISMITKAAEGSMQAEGHQSDGDQQLGAA